MKKKDKSTILLVIVFLVGLSLLLYPSFSNWWNSMHASRAVATYMEQVADTSLEKKAILHDEAAAYNTELALQPLHLNLTEEEIEQYDSILDVTGTGIMGYIEIPSIRVKLPIYHGTDEGVLQIAVGHIAGTSLPIGGIGTHSVVSGHRGLPSAKLFTNIDRLKEGDTFLLNVLDETLTYEVDQILIVLPDEVDALKIDPEMDYCTLVTCTPYGINSHRLLVRGHRVENDEEDSVRVSADAMLMDPIMVAPILAIPILIVLLILVITGGLHRNTKKKIGKGN